jgi:hypothetical protein
MAAPNTFNRWYLVVPSDTVDLPQGPPASIWCGSSGNLAAMMQDGTVGTFQSIPSGVLLPITPKRIMATNTTMAGIYVLYQV